MFIGLAAECGDESFRITCLAYTSCLASCLSRLVGVGGGGGGCNLSSGGRPGCGVLRYHSVKTIPDTT